MQSTQNILMIRPANFSGNEETAVNNSFQKSIDKSQTDIQKQAKNEFDKFVTEIKKHNINVLVVEDTHLPVKPDAIFPNNWISFHKNGDIALYPMFSKKRRLERREDILEQLHEKGFILNNVLDYSEAEKENYFLEGTGSMVLDRENEIAYCSLSERSDEDLFIEFCEDFEYLPIIFNSNSANLPVYHTNVLLSISSSFAIICLDVIPNKSDKKDLLNHLKRTKKKVISITENQMNNFCGNCLELHDNSQNLKLVMSTRAFNNFTESQVAIIQETHEIIHSDLTTIENYGGGSARCMIAEIFNPFLTKTT